MSRTYGIAPRPSPPIISPACRLSLGCQLLRFTFNSPASGASPWSGAANVLKAVPFVLEAKTTFYKAYWGMGAAGGTANREVGIWDDAYNKIVTTGAVAGDNSNSVPQVAALSATVTLPPGPYYMGMAFAATTTGTNHRWSLATLGTMNTRAMGLWAQASITLGSLAATATPVVHDNLAIPVFGLITRSVFDV